MISIVLNVCILYNKISNALIFKITKQNSANNWGCYNLDTKRKSLRVKYKFFFIQSRVLHRKSSVTTISKFNAFPWYWKVAKMVLVANGIGCLNYTKTFKFRFIYCEDSVRWLFCLYCLLYPFLLLNNVLFRSVFVCSRVVGHKI